MPTSPSQKLPTTLGVELEFNGFTHLEGRNENAHQTAAQACLVAAGIEVGRPKDNYSSCLTSYAVGLDGSCGFKGQPGAGIEVRSKIMTTEDDLAECLVAVNCLKAAGGVTNTNCGMHVHLGYDKLDRVSKYRFTRFMIRHEKAFFDIADESRQNNSFCGRISPDVRAKLLAGNPFETSFKTYLSHDESNRWNSTRRIWFNVQALEKFGTFENRLWHGSLDEKIVSGWLNTQLQIAKLTMVDLKKFDWELEPGMSAKERLDTFITEICHDDTPRTALVHKFLRERADAALARSKKVTKAVNALGRLVSQSLVDDQVIST